MPTDEEIKEFIDSREVLTKKELSRFIYNTWRNDGAKLNYWWTYALENKDWNALRDYRDKKIYQQEGFNRFLELIPKDSRLTTCGSRQLVTYLSKLYNFKISRPTAVKYLKQLRGINAK